MAPHPGVDVESVREGARKDLLDLLENIRGKKNLVIEKALAGPIGLLVKFSTLQQYGVDKVFFLENDNVDSTQRNVVFLVRSDKADQALAVAEQIKRLQAGQSDHEFNAILVPRKTLVINKVFEDAGVLGDIVVDEFPLFFLPIAEDVLSLELSDSFTDLYLRKDPTCLYNAARALMSLQRSHGLFPRILGKGDHAHRLMEMLMRMRSEAAATQTSSMFDVEMMPSTHLESLIIIDREVDFATVLLTELTYEGLIDELFNIKDNQIEASTSVVGAASGQSSAGPQQSSKRKVVLDSTDKVFEQLRDSNFAVVANQLNQLARRLEKDYETRHSAKSTSELREFVSKLPGYQVEQQGLRVHSGLVEEIMKYTNSDLFRKLLEIQQNLVQGADPSAENSAIEELMARDTSITDVLRLLCLQSCVSGGLKPKDLDELKTQVLHAYGYQHILTLNALEKMQLLVPRTSANIFALPSGSTAPSAVSKTNYAYLRKALRLIVNEVNEQDPNDISYVYSGYAPLSVRLVQCILQKQFLTAFTRSGLPAQANGNGVSTAAHGWQGFEDALKATRGPTFNKTQKGNEAATKARTSLSGTSGRKTIVVMFVGGITRTEVAALRFLAKQDPQREILICTTSFINGNLMMKSAMETRTFGGG